MMASSEEEDAQRTAQRRRAFVFWILQKVPFKKAHWDVQHERHAEAEEKRPQDIEQPARRVRQQRQVLQGPVKEYRRTRDAQDFQYSQFVQFHRNTPFLFHSDRFSDPSYSMKTCPQNKTL